MFAAALGLPLGLATCTVLGTVVQTWSLPSTTAWIVNVRVSSALRVKPPVVKVCPDNEHVAVAAPQSAGAPEFNAVFSSVPAGETSAGKRSVVAEGGSAGGGG